MTQSSTSVLSDSLKVLPQKYEFEDIRVSIERIQALLERGETLLYGEEVQRELFPGCTSSNTAVAGGNEKKIYRQQPKTKKLQQKQNPIDQQQQVHLHMHQTGESKGTQQRCSPLHPGMNGEDSVMQQSVLRRKTANSLTTATLQQMSPGSTELSRRSTNSTLSKNAARSGKLKRLNRDMHEYNDNDDDDKRVDISIEELFLRIRRELEDYRNNYSNNNNNKSNR
ncbi:hypothetical protein LSM04_003345 [Trypanosoma melophagium]|uniref:uncharacterized protein n=1 Tax=Trypanosoma melophagium TaxID=715481 RepID=UPI00351A08FB|nr:hypothetical protein LSM04_003345 [Trypanosoma melophagium]